MNRRVDVAFFIGNQELYGGNYIPLYLLMLKDGLKDPQQRYTYPYFTTITDKTLKRLIPNIVFPANPKRHDPNSQGPIPKESIAYVKI